MRISTGQIYTNANQNMMENQSSLADIQNKLASGKEFTSLAEDPVGASRVVGLQRELAQLEMYQGNVDASRRRLQLEETTIDDLNTATDRMRELVLQAANGTMSDPDRVAISYELEDLVEYAAGLMNTRDAKGEYLFSGSQGSTQTYVKGADGRYEYMGDSSSRSIQVSSALYAQSTDSGQFLFESVLSEPGLSATGSLKDALQDDSIVLLDTDQFAAFMRETGDISVNVDQYVDGGGNTVSTYTLRDSVGNVVVDVNGDPLQNVVFTTGDVTEIELPGAELSLSLEEPTSVTPSTLNLFGSGASIVDQSSISSEADFLSLMRAGAGDISLQADYDAAAGTYAYTVSDNEGNLLTSGSGLASSSQTINIPGAPGVSFDVELSGITDTAEVTFAVDTPSESELKLQFDQPPSNILNEVLDMVDLMREPVAGDAQARTELQARFALTLDQLTMSQERLSEAVATIGSRLNTLDNAESSNMDFQLMAESTLSSVQDLDYAAASTELAKRQLALEAAYASFNRIQSLSLFDYIR